MSLVGSVIFENLNVALGAGRWFENGMIFICVRIIKIDLDMGGLYRIL